MKIPAGVAALDQKIRELEKMIINPLNVANSFRHHIHNKVDVYKSTAPIVAEDGSVSFYINDTAGGMLKVTVGQYKAPIK